MNLLLACESCRWHETVLSLACHGGLECPAGACGSAGLSGVCVCSGRAQPACHSRATGALSREEFELGSKDVAGA